MSGFNNYYEDPFSENPFSNHFTSLSSEHVNNIRYNDKLLNNRIDFKTNNSSILERNDNGIMSVMNKDVISKSLKDNIQLARKYSRDNYCCATHCAFTSNKEKIPLITITDALKITDMSGTSFIVYVIRTSEPEKNSTLLEVRRRYSEFASLRNLLHQYYPSLIIPPIPEKHSLTEYAIKQGKAKDNPKIIEKRKRMLQVFLNRLGKHPVFASLHIFHVFLEPGNWLEYENKMSKVSIPISLTSFDVSEELQYKDIKKNVKEFMKCIALLSKSHNNLMNLYQNLSHSYSSLGASYNGWSLHEVGLSPVLEAVGQSSDNNRLALCRMISLLDITVMESLQEYNAFSKIILNIITWYKNNYRQYYYICNSLSKKQKKLENLIRAEERAQKRSEAQKAKEIKKREKALEKEKEKENKQKKNEKKDDVNSVISSDSDEIDDEKPNSNFNDITPYSKNVPTGSNEFNDSLFNNNDLKTKVMFETLDQNEINPKIDDDNPFNEPIKAPSIALPENNNNGILTNDIIYNEPNSLNTTQDATISLNNSINKEGSKSTRQNEIASVKSSIVRLQQLKELQYKEIIKSGKEIQYDFTYFQREKYSDFKQILIHYAKINREYNEQMIKVWNNMLKIWNEIRV